MANERCVLAESMWSVEQARAALNEAVALGLLIDVCRCLAPVAPADRNLHGDCGAEEGAEAI